MNGNGWRRVSRSKPCPVCRKADWCTVAADGSVACCMRVESPKRLRNGGWLHRLRESDEWRHRHVRRVTLPKRRPAADFGQLAEQYHEVVNPFDLVRLAADLGVDRGAFWRLEIGWDGRAWTFPMRDAGGVVTGIRRRFPDGGKLSVQGGREGLFVPSELPASGLLLVTEGPTDCAALLTLGFAALGRPSCSGGMRLVCDLARGRDTVVVADGDEPGRRGAEALASVLRLYCPSVRMIHPPEGVKDARAWLRAGARCEDISAAIEGADVLRLRVRVEHGR